MLQSIIINKLFGTFDYKIDFSSLRDDRICFLTAPNGYGKTTILRFIDGLYNRRFDVFFSIPFESIDYIIDGVSVRIEQHLEPCISEVSDETTDKFITILFDKENVAGGCKLTQKDIQPDAPTDNLNSVINQLNLFFASENCVFIDDRRLLRENNNDSELVRFTEIVKKHLATTTSNLQIETFRKIVERSDFVNKRLELDASFGFRFIANDALKTKLAMTSLSSGEQHILLQALYLIFEAPYGTLVLIDEPEMSFHLSWQGDYLTNMKDIVDIRHIQCIVATHSPIVFDEEHSRTIDLFELQQGTY